MHSPIPRSPVLRSATRCTPKRQPVYYHARQGIPPFTPHLRDPHLPVNVLVEEFLHSQRFELMCCQAIQLAGIIPVTPPPIPFISFESTPLHQYYEAIIVEFVNSFARMLRKRGLFPTILENQEGIVSTKDDIDMFNFECRAHINAMMISFDAPGRPFGSLQNLKIDKTLLKDKSRCSCSPGGHPSSCISPQGGLEEWRTATLRTSKEAEVFRMGVIRQIQESVEDAWILDMVDELERGIGTFAEYFIAQLREESLGARARAASPFSLLG